MVWTLFSLTAGLLAWDPPAPPIMVRVVQDEPSTGFDLADVLIKSLGLTVAITVLSLLLGAILGGTFIWLRALRSRRRPDASSAGLHVTPQS